MVTAIETAHPGATHRRARAPAGAMVDCRRAGRALTPRAFVPHLAAVAIALSAGLPAGPLAAQTSANAGTRVAAGGGRDVIVLSAPAASAAAGQEAVPGFAAQSHETATHRIYEVSFGGETFRAATPLRGPGPRIVFDPNRRTFVALLPSIRVVLDEGVRIEALAAHIGATGVTVFESLGFAILDLPGDTHPADAVKQANRAFANAGASVRVRGPRIEWR